MADEMIMKEILYYIYEMEMPEECRKIIQEAAEKAHMTTDQLFCGWLKYLVENPEETKKVKADWDALIVEERAKYEQIKLVRIYPVHEGESDEAARAIAVYKERYGKQIPLPEISQTDFIEHLDDDNFFLAYGNPVVVKADDGRQALYMAWPMAERLMRETGRGAEADAIIREVREAYEREKG